MKNCNVLFVFLAIILAVGCGSKNPSQKILETFNKKYPEAKTIEWKNHDGNWEAEYKIGDRSYASLFDLNESWIQTKYQIDYGLVPKVVQEVFSLKYSLDDLATVYKVEMKEKNYYEFMMHTPSEKYKITYDETGKFFERDRE